MSFVARTRMNIEKLWNLLWFFKPDVEVFPWHDFLRAFNGYLHHDNRFIKKPGFCYRPLVGMYPILRDVPQPSNPATNSLSVYWRGGGDTAFLPVLSIWLNSTQHDVLCGLSMIFRHVCTLIGQSRQWWLHRRSVHPQGSTGSSLVHRQTKKGSIFMRALEVGYILGTPCPRWTPPIHLGPRSIMSKPNSHQLYLKFILEC